VNGDSVQGGSEKIVEAEDLHRRYGEGEAAVEALAGITVAFPAGRYAAIMGPSGSRKSTLMHILAGLNRPTSGSVRIGVVGAVLVTSLALSGSGYVQSIPLGTLVILLVVAALAGLLAAQLPARRAARLDMLQALASE
jgi:ABC-type Na+ transport system ATPase subunit NatA